LLRKANQQKYIFGQSVYIVFLDENIMKHGVDLDGMLDNTWHLRVCQLLPLQVIEALGQESRLWTPSTKSPKLTLKKKPVDKNLK
jgi:hypothetical protein